MASPLKNVTPSVLWYYDTNKQLNYIAFAATMEEIHAGAATVSKYPVQKGFEVSNHLIRHNKRVQIRAYIPETLLGGLETGGADAGFTISAMANKYLGVDFVDLSTLVGGVITDPFGVATNYLEGAVHAVAPKVNAITNTFDSVTGKLDQWFGTDMSMDVSGMVDDFIPSSTKKTTASSSRRIDAFQKIQQIQDEGLICCLGTVLKEYNDLVLVEYSVPTNDKTLSCMFVDLTFEQILTVNSAGQQTVNLSLEGISEEAKQNAISVGSKFHESGAASWVKDTLGSLV